MVLQRDRDEVKALNVPWPPMGCEEWWWISVGLSTVKLDHFFMAAPYIFLFACY
jgi:hypothetical protein